MKPGEKTKNDAGSATSASWFVVGSVLGGLSALVLAWSGTVCVDVLKALFVRDLSELEALGKRLGRVCWFPMGVAVGTTLIAAGFRRTALRGRLSQRCLGFVVLYGVLAACGAFFVFQGTRSVRVALFDFSRSGQPVDEEQDPPAPSPIKSEDVLAAVSQAATPVSRGWVLLAVAQVLLSIGGLVQLADQSKSIVGSRHWPKSATMALSLLWVFGAVASLSWFRRSWEILELRGNSPIRASGIVEMFSGVLSHSWIASLFLLGHAVLTTVVAVATYRTLKKRGQGTDPVACQ